MKQKSSVTKFLPVIGLAALAAIAGWQFFLFATFKDATGVVNVQGGTLHLWLAIGITMLVCLGGFLVFSKVVRYDRENDLHITAQGSPLGVAANNKRLK